MEIKGIQVECNLSDIRTIKIFELGRKEIIDLQTDPKFIKLMMYEQAELICTNIVKFITDLFGEDICKKLISNPNDFMICIETFKNVGDVLKEEFNIIENKLLKYDLSRIQ